MKILSVGLSLCLCFLLTACPSGDYFREDDEGVIVFDRSRICIKLNEGESLDQYTVIYFSLEEERSRVTQKDEGFNNCVNENLLHRNGRYILKYITKIESGDIRSYSVAFWMKN